jgi:hypothetical protein
LRKIINIIFISVLVSGCSVARHGKNDISEVAISDDPGKLLEIIRVRNLTENSFFIQKAEVDVRTEKGKNRFISTIKFKKPDNYLVSIKNMTGIEIARIFLSKDSIFVNDRINRKLYRGSSDYLKNKYGVSFFVLPVIFGDIVAGTLIERGYKISGEAISSSIDGELISYIINNKIKKVIKAINVSNSRDDIASLNFGKFQTFKGITIPQYVEIQNNKGKSLVKLKIRKVQIPWEGNLEFIPGNKYEIIELK